MLLCQQLESHENEPRERAFELLCLLLIVSLNFEATRALIVASQAAASIQATPCLHTLAVYTTPSVESRYVAKSSGADGVGSASERAS